MIFQFGSKTKLFGGLLRRNKPFAQAILQGGEDNVLYMARFSFTLFLRGHSSVLKYSGFQKGKGIAPKRSLGSTSMKGKAVSEQRRILFLLPACITILKIARIHFTQGICRRLCPMAATPG